MPRVGSSRMSRFGFGEQPAGQQHLLLVAAGQVADQGVRAGRPDVEGLDVAVGELVLLAARDLPGPAALGLHGQHDVGPDAQVADQPLRLAVLRGEGDLLVQRQPRAAQLDVLPGDRGGPGVAAIGAVEQPDQLGPSGAEQPGQADHLTGVDLQVERLDRALAAQRLCGEEGAALDAFDGLPLGALFEGLQRGEVLADHLGDQLQPGQFGDQVLADQLTVAQHGDAVGDLVDLIEEVRDEQHRDALVPDLADHRHQFGDLLDVQRRGGLVQHQHLGVDVDGPADRHQLLDGDGMRAEQRPGIDVQVETARAPLRRACASGGSRSAPAGGARGRA